VVECFLDAVEEAEDLKVIVTGTLLINYLHAHVLFDSGVTHSFINPKFVKELACKSEEMDT